MISIAMATYNGAKYLNEQLDSILKQKVTDFELIICDDCSTDETKNILEKYRSKDKRVKVFFNEKNLGYVKNFEKAISMCTGDYIALSDQDDIWLPNHLNLLLDGIKEHYLCGADATLVNSDNKELGSTLFESFTIDTLPENVNDFRFMILYRSIFQGSAMMVTRELVNSALPFPSGIKFHDYWLVYYAFLLWGENYSGMKTPVNYVKTPILRYRQHGKNVTENKKFTIQNSLHTVIGNFFDKGKGEKNKKSIGRHIQELEILESYINSSLKKKYTKENEIYLRDLKKMKIFFKILQKRVPFGYFIFYIKNYYRLTRCNSKKLCFFRIIKKAFGM